MNFVSKAQVVEIVTHHEDIREYTFKLDKEQKYSPGSFVQLTLDLVSASDIWPESRTFSIASYQKGFMRFIIKNAGAYTNRIFEELGVGSFCTVKYPFGDLFNKSTVDEKHVLIAGGIGITPYLAIVEYFTSVGKLENIHLMYSTKYKGELLHLNQLKEMLGNNLHVYITREKTEDYINRRITVEDLRKLADQSANIYVCGSKIFNAEFKIKLGENGYNKIHMDEWE